MKGGQNYYINGNQTAEYGRPKPTWKQHMVMEAEGIWIKDAEDPQLWSHGKRRRELLNPEDRLFVFV